MNHTTMHRTESNSVIPHALQDQLLGTFESSRTPLNRLLLADCPSFGQGQVRGGAQTHVGVYRVLFSTTCIITAGAQIRDSHFHGEWKKKEMCRSSMTILFLLSRGVNGKQSGELCHFFCFLRLGEGVWVQTICPILSISFLALGLGEKRGCRWVCLPFSSLSREPHGTSSHWVSQTL